MTNNEDKEACSKCGGLCCTTLPGCNSPADFNDSEKEIAQALKSGRYTLDCWDGEFEGIFDPYFVRPATQGLENILVDRSWGGICTFWTKEKGCKLTWKQRPLGCKSLLINKLQPGNCSINSFGKKESVRAWLPYQNFLRNIVERSDT